MRTDRDGKGHRLVSLIGPDKYAFNDDELSIILIFRERFKRPNTQEISDFFRKEKA